MAKRRIVFKRVRYRLVALVAVLLGSVAVRYYTNPQIVHYVFHVDIPPPLETEAGDRDLAQYDFGGHVENCDQSAGAEGCYKDRKEARKFIEDHFKARRRGYIIVNGASIDLPPTAHFFIEPSEIGNWEVRVRIQVPGPYTRFRRNMNTIYYSEVFRRRIRKGEPNIRHGSSALVLRARGVYELLL